MTYLRRSKPEAVCQEGNDISSSTVEKAPDSCCGTEEDVLQTHNGQPWTHLELEPAVEDRGSSPHSHQLPRALSGFGRT